MTHHLYGPSSLYRRAACPGSARQERVELCALGDGAVGARVSPDGGRAPSVSGPDAVRGNRLHEAVIEPAIYNSLDPDEQGLVACCHEFLNSVEGAEWKHGMRVQIYRPGKFARRLMCYGTLDAVALFPDHGLAVLADWKFGYKETPPAWDNYQVGAYAVGLWQEFPWITKVACSIVQPTLRDGNWPVYAITDFEQALANLIAIVDACEDPNAPLHPGAHCQYCVARSRCQAVCDSVVKTVGTVSLAVTPDNAAEVWDACAAAEAMASALKDRVREMLDSQGVPGLRKVVVSGRRKVYDIAGLYERVKEVMPATELMGLCSIPVSSLEGALAVRLREKKGLDVRASKAAAAQAIAPYTESAPATTRIVREKDNP